jgi:hypothetical protein
MANGSSGSNAVGWVVLGFLAGVAATLGVMVFLQSGHARHTDAESAAAPVAASEAPAMATQTAPTPKPAPSAKPAAPAAAVAAANDADQQVQEDAAAAGMTSRRKTPADTPPN